MKYILTICLCGLLLSSCKKTDEVKPQAGSDTAKVFVPPQRDAFDDSMKNIDKNKMKTHQGAIEFLMNLPPGGPIPPHLLPAKDIKLVSATANAAIYSFTSGTTGEKEKVMMKRNITDGKDTIWNIEGVEPAK
jgi:hypothetical protein